MVYGIVDGHHHPHHLRCRRNTRAKISFTTRCGYLHTSRACNRPFSDCTNDLPYSEANKSNNYNSAFSFLGWRLQRCRISTADVLAKS